LDTLSFRVNDLTQEVIDGQSQCTNKRIEREKEIIAQIDELQNMLRGSIKPHPMAMKRTNDTIVVETMRVIPDDNTELAISALHELKNRIKNGKH
jgi:hypothetical protein